MYLTPGQVRRPQGCWAPGCPFPLPFLKSASGVGGDRGCWGWRVGEAPRSSPHQARDAAVHPDLTVALANPIKFFNAHDKKSLKLKEAMGGLPEVCVAGPVTRGPRSFALSVGR